jgi:hypothetical protein
MVNGSVFEVSSVGTKFHLLESWLRVKIYEIDLVNIGLRKVVTDRVLINFEFKGIIYVFVYIYTLILRFDWYEIAKFHQGNSKMEKKRLFWL